MNCHLILVTWEPVKLINKNQIPRLFRRVLHHALKIRAVIVRACHSSVYVWIEDYYVIATCLLGTFSDLTFYGLLCLSVARISSINNCCLHFVFSFSSLYFTISATKQLKKALTYTKYGSAFFHCLFIWNWGIEMQSTCKGAVFVQRQWKLPQAPLVVVKVILSSICQNNASLQAMFSYVATPKAEFSFFCFTLPLQSKIRLQKQGW